MQDGALFLFKQNPNPTKTLSSHAAGFPETLFGAYMAPKPDFKTHMTAHDQTVLSCTIRC